MTTLNENDIELLAAYSKERSAGISDFNMSLLDMINSHRNLIKEITVYRNDWFKEINAAIERRWEAEKKTSDRRLIDINDLQKMTLLEIADLIK